MNSTSGEQWSVLLIEDDPDQARLLSRWLQSEPGCVVVHATDGNAGADRILSGEWDLVISDIELPGQSGLDLLRLSKDTHRFTPTLLITAHESVEYAVDAIRGRADDFLIKPLVRAVFLSKVRTLLHQGADLRRKGQQSVLAIGAHPDDVEIGVGGILLRHRAGGDRIAVLTLTGGEEGGAKSQRVLESEAAAAMLGARLFLRDLPDARVSEGQQTIAEIDSVIRAVAPTTIYTHSLNDGHQDHRAVHRATIVAARSIPNLYCYQAPSTDIGFRPTLFVEVAEHLDGKIRAISAYHSQTATRPYLAESLIRSTAQYWGRFAGYRHVEPLEVIRDSG